MGNGTIMLTRIDKIRSPITEGSRRKCGMLVGKAGIIRPLNANKVLKSR